MTALNFKNPHPSPLPEGEGTDPGMLKKHADLNLLYRFHNRLGRSGRYTTPDPSVGPLYLWERAGVRGSDRENSDQLKPTTRQLT